MIVLVCGGRNYREWQMVYAVLDELHPTAVIQGGANGADSHARGWCASRAVTCVTEFAKWSDGRKAGPIRNAKMLTHNPDLVVAFPGGVGTADMVARARKAGFEVRKIARRAATPPTGETDTNQGGNNGSPDV